MLKDKLRLLLMMTICIQINKIRASKYLQVACMRVRHMGVVNFTSV